MDFTDVKTTAGKPCILFKDFKYRQQRTLKSGDINWRCLTGKNCGASIKTDANLTRLSIVNEKYTGAHAVTMRQMKSPGHAQSTSSSTLSPATCSTPSSVPLHSVSLSSATANFSPHTSAASTPLSAAAPSNAVVTPTQPATPTTSNVESSLPDGPHPNTPKSTCLTEIQAENSSLRTPQAFTDELFVVNPSRNETPSTSSSEAEIVPIEPGEQRSSECKNKQCTEPQTTIEVLKSGKSSCTCKEAKEENSTQWTQPKQKTRNTETSVTPVVFSTVTVEGDSHVRSLAGLVQSLVTAKTSVFGVCKPGAGLLGVVEGGQSPLPGSCCVLIAGANDVGAGESSPIFQHLEQQIIVRTSTAKVVVSTVPYRHDLSTDHPINKQTNLVNHYIRDLCARCEGSVLLDTIGRRHFIRHGQHLTMGGKRLLARLVVDGLRRASSVSLGRTQPPPSLPLPSSAAPAGSPSIATAEPQSPPTLSPGLTTDTAVPCVPPNPTTPWTLPHDSYADAVRSSSSNVRFNQTLFF
ncbi:hypothetical protein J6590_046152 [Homalodisca vitripennis]|nr:hypothetical protein J6590_046152 [Homalodisca vitripennis]